MNTRFSAQLVKLRKRENLSQQELALKIDVNAQNITDWESETTVPNLTQLINLANFFDVTLDSLAYGSAAPNSNYYENKNRGEINNFYEFIARYWWLIFPIGGFIIWIVSVLQ